MNHVAISVYSFFDRRIVMAEYTPMMQQYLSVKADVQDALLFFRLGDFYEMFFEDALTASRELEITLTGRDAGREERVPMCGVPYHAAEGYIAKLIDKGYKVAICEQVEDPKSAKGVVRREVVRIVTPGTVMESKQIQEAANNFIVGTALRDGRYGLAACDLTTGELYATSFEAAGEAVRNALNVYKPAEVVGDEPSLAIIGEEARNAGRTMLFTRLEKADLALLAVQFPGENWQAHDEARKTAIARLIGYLGETQKRSLAHINAVKFYEPSSYMALDAFTRRNLELTETVRDRSRKGSLLWLLDRTRTAMGARLLRRWIDQPLLDRQEIDQRLDAVEALHDDWMRREELRGELGEVYDLERLVGRIAYGTANARDLNALRDSLDRVPAIQSSCRASGSAPLVRLADQLDACQDIADAIRRAIADDPPVSIREGGLIRPGFDPKLDELREASQNGKRWIAELEQKEREATGIKSLKVGFNKVFGYYLEVTRANLDALPEGRYERKQTLANAERFVTQELKEKEALILEAEERMVDLEYETFIRLRTDIAAHIPRLQRLAEKLATLDVLQSLAETAAEHRYIRPAWSEGFDLHIEDGRHPVVEAVAESGSFIANHTALTRDQSILLITGPNMAGKSTYMRQVAMICLMAQIGSFVPAKRASLPLIDRIFTRIGAADDLVGGQSTFMVEMKDIQVMTSQATERSLVIIDELGRGTSTEEGMAIAQAVIEYVHDHIRCKALVSTHFHELAHLESSLSGLRNGCMAVKESAEGVTFLRKLVPGAADSSYGIYCAQLAGLPDAIIQRAYALIEQGHRPAEMAALEAAPAQSGPDEPGPSKDEAGIVQLSLFADATSPVNAKPKRTSVADPLAKLADKLLKLDVLRMTPLQALEWLNDARNQLINDKE
jgi:DNA mismatch repair protein MutS